MRVCQQGIGRQCKSVPQQMLSLGGLQASPTKEERSKWDSEECSLANASQLRVARNETAPTSACKKSMGASASVLVRAVLGSTYG